MLYWLYTILGTFLFFLLLPFVTLYFLFRPQPQHALAERIGNIPAELRKKKGNSPVVWMHAASVGEVQAARALIAELQSESCNCTVVISTMTVQGRNVARKLLPSDVVCFLAPLDVPPVVRRMLNWVEPSHYICLETELWPAMLVGLKKRGTKMALLNGRMTERSFRRYSLVSGLIREVLSGFSIVGVIGSEDGCRFGSLGVPAERIVVTGNIKYDFAGEDREATRKQYRSVLAVTREKVFICGSTRSGEEQILAEVFQRLSEMTGEDFVWVIAPRHLERLDEIRDLFKKKGIEYDLYTELDRKPRKTRTVLVDCMGELSKLYSAGDFIFCGGSLVDKGGHNVMEAARWGRPVYYGSFMSDFRDAVDILEKGGAGFEVADGRELFKQIVSHLHDASAYRKACDAAARVLSGQRGASARQASIVRSLLAH